MTTVRFSVSASGVDGKVTTRDVLGAIDGKENVPPGSTRDPSAPVEW